jgi:hypothetical protein
MPLSSLTENLTLESLTPLLLLVAAGAWLGMTLQRVTWRARAKRRRDASNDFKIVHRSPAPPVEDLRASDAVRQLRIVMGADFAARPLLNKSEARVFDELCEIVMRCRPDWRVMAQVSLGEILRSKDAEAYGCINSKRVDMLIVDENRRPRHAIEYQGNGHYQGTAAARDAVKKEALRKAGIGYHEVVAGKTTPGDLRLFVENLIGKGDTPGQ